MINLLSANFDRLKKNKVFHSTLLATLILGFAIVVHQYSYIIRYDDTIILERLLFLVTIIVSITSSICASLFISDDYQNGTIRNKIILGNKKQNIYLANLLTISFASLVETTLYMALVTTIGLPLIGPFTMPLSQILYYILDSVLIAIVFASIYTAIGMNSSSITKTAIISILTPFVFIFISVIILTKLTQPKYYPITTITNGVYETQNTPNPKYIDGPKREFVKFFGDIIPTTQGFQLAELFTYKANYKVFALYSTIEILIINTFGIIKFKRKELN